MKKKSTLASAYGTTRLQQMQEQFAAIIEMAIILVNPYGEPITQYSRCSRFYRAVTSTAEGQKLYQQTIYKLCEKTGNNPIPTTMPCPNTGLLLAAIPIVVDDVVLGNWIIGQVRIGQELDYYDSYMLQLDYRIDISSHTLKMLVCELPQISMETFRCNVQLMQQLSENAFKQAGGLPLPKLPKMEKEKKESQKEQTSTPLEGAPAQSLFTLLYSKAVMLLRSFL